MKHATLTIALVLFSSTGAGQGVPPVMRYNGVVENIFILHRCGALTKARLAWLDNVREHAMRAAGWGEAEADAQDRLLTPEFERRYAAGIPKERCDLLARATDHERATTRLAP